MKRSIIAVVALAVLVAVWVYHRAQAGPHATPVTTTITIPGTDDTWAPPPPGAAAAMTPEQAWLKQYSVGLHGETVQLGLITSPFSQNQLAYGYYWSDCGAGINNPPNKCWNWDFLDANTGAVITGESWNTP
jgi:hypothetical protein